MRFDGQERTAHLDVVAPSIIEIEARVRAAERLLGVRDPGTTLAMSTLEEKIDRNHAKVMDALHRREESLRNEVLGRLARIERKLQIVA